MALIALGKHFESRIYFKDQHKRIPELSLHETLLTLLFNILTI